MTKEEAWKLVAEMTAEAIEEGLDPATIAGLEVRSLRRLSAAFQMMSRTDPSERCHIRADELEAETRILRDEARKEEDRWPQAYDDLF